MASTDEDALVTLSIICIIYSILIGAGGFYAYKFKESKASLAAGGSASICLLVTSLVTIFLPKRVEAWGVLAVITLGLIVFAGVRWRMFPGDDGQRKFMPMGMLAVVSTVVLLLELIALIIIST
mmetsp:Transcript_11046/g.28076  ORF Transcript_11046/g.28076 Transcript_11046/m.28076 type:complete len:124 (+) Transcript_11046:35-406(+)|eukprot:CAMPEP_0197423718 /NCGR_PEP_ID=MMETSP1170-20131217/22215_1 /TAXON_ID=54406 /ORGANISM="Sarcinochrysis sp, Strain CCMP770" /LENGTH=123 /DNA_ID=CAMNT_0042951159 /DNA_START=34 /DNA_END=405 /DNA_ORIENTATION=-